MTTSRGAYAADVRAWVAHLRGGGSTTWSRFAGGAAAGARESSPELSDASLPGAAQLELLRRLSRHVGRAVPPELADRVLTRDGPGRGLGHRPLPHPGTASLLGPAPLAPAAVPVRELIRIGVGVLADYAVDASKGATSRGAATRDATELPAVEALRRHAPRTRSEPFPLGAPFSRFALARSASGIAPDEVVVCAPTLDEMLTEVWSARTQLGGGVRWRRFVRTWARQDRLPPSADVELLAERAARRVGRSRVHVFFGAAARPEPSMSALPVEAVDVLRRLNPVLRLRLDGHLAGVGRQWAMGWLGPDGGLALGVPEETAAWAHQRSVRMLEAVRAGGYSVHGNEQEFVRGLGGPQGPRPTAVLDRLLEALAEAANARSV